MKHQFNIGDGVTLNSWEEAKHILILAKTNGYEIDIGNICFDYYKSFVFDKYQTLTSCSDDSLKNPIPKQKFIKLIIQKTMKSTKITPPEGYEVDKDKSTFEEIVFKKIEKKYPTSVEEIDRPYFLDSAGGIVKFEENQTPNNFSTIERSKQILALIQVLELRDAWNKIDGFVAKWETVHQKKFSIYCYRGEIVISEAGYRNSPLYFNSQETAQLFLDHFTELIEECKELI